MCTRSAAADAPRPGTHRRRSPPAPRSGSTGNGRDPACRSAAVGPTCACTACPNSWANAAASARAAVRPEQHRDQRGGIEDDAVLLRAVERVPGDLRRVADAQRRARTVAPCGVHRDVPAGRRRADPAPPAADSWPFQKSCRSASTAATARSPSARNWPGPRICEPGRPNDPAARIGTAGRRSDRSARRPAACRSTAAAAAPAHRGDHQQQTTDQHDHPGSATTTSPGHAKRRPGRIGVPRDERSDGRLMTPH